VGIKELWEIPAGRVAKGEVIYTLGYPLTGREYGGAWVYGIDETESRGTLVSVGYVTGLDYQDPRTDPHHVFQSFKEHRLARRILEGGKMIRYGAKSLPYGGWLTMPRIYGNAWMLLGDSASFLNSQRLKGIHLAIKSGMLAAEAAFDALVAGDSSADTLSSYKAAVDRSWIREELWRVRNFHQGFEHGMLEGLVKAGIQEVMGGGNLGPDAKNHAGYTRMEPVDAMGPADEKRVQMIGNAPGDGKLTGGQVSFSRLTDVFYSGTRHDEDQPVHLVVEDLNICSGRCTKEFGNPCQYFCPAAVYEMVDVSDAGDGVSDARQTASDKIDPGVGHDLGRQVKKELRINFTNCVHCKTCDIMDPYQIITWVPPEGGGGPNYDGM
jgi:electron-transferring-flavoprotein dehydrogenase